MNHVHIPSVGVKKAPADDFRRVPRTLNQNPSHKSVRHTGPKTHGKALHIKNVPKSAFHSDQIYYRNNTSRNHESKHKSTWKITREVMDRNAGWAA